MKYGEVGMRFEKWGKVYEAWRIGYEIWEGVRKRVWGYGGIGV